MHPNPHGAKSAEAILAAYLDRMSRAVLDDDWPAYEAGVFLPFVLRTEAATLVISTEADLREGFEAFVEMLSSQRITGYVRTVRTAERIGGDVIRGTYDTETLSGSVRVIPRFSSSIELRSVSGVWKAVQIVNQMKNARWPIALPTVD